MNHWQIIGLHAELLSVAERHWCHVPYRLGLHHAAELLRGAAIDAELHRSQSSTHEMIDVTPEGSSLRVHVLRPRKPAEDVPNG